MRRKLVIGNWKMNGSRSANEELLSSVVAGAENLVCDLAVCVPFVYLPQCQQILANTRVAWGSQDISAHEAGAYTGEISATMLRDFVCRYAIVGHSERRAYHAETDAIVASKAQRALAAGLTPVICVGETLEQRDAGHTQTVVSSQVEAVLAALSTADLSSIVLAYEPVWAIGTGKTATPAMAQQVHAMLRALLSMKHPASAARTQILYGGSMKPDNAAELLSMPDIDGGLIGGAALKANDFLAIAHAANVASNSNLN